MQPLVLMDANAFLPRVGGPGLAREIERLVPGSKVAVPESVLRELDRLVARKVPGSRLGRELAKALPVVRTSGERDEAIVAAARARHAIVLTADRGLRDRLLSEGLPVLYPRDRGRLTLARNAPERSRRATVKTRSRLESRSAPARKG